jgi:hypothetical protein
MAHVFARLSGFGLVVTPHPRYRLERVAGSPETVLRVATTAAESADASDVVDLSAVARGEASSERIDVAPGRPGPGWRVETGVFTCAWPDGFALSHDPDGLSPFLLLGERDAMIWVSGPVTEERVRPIEKLAAPGQTIRAVAGAEGAERIDVEYEAEAEAWWQRRYAIAWGEGRALVLTAQARRADEAPVRDAIDLIERSLSPYQPD